MAMSAQVSVSRERVVILGVEKARITDGEDCRLSSTLNLCHAEIDDLIHNEFSAEIDRCYRLRQHRATEMQPTLLVGQNVREKNALIDFDAVLLRLHQLGLGLDLPFCRHEAGNELGRVVTKLIDAN